MRRLMRRTSTSTASEPAGQPSRTSIATRLRWSYLISSTLPLLIVGALLLRINTGAQQENVYNDQKNLASRTARNISKYIQDMSGQLNTFALSLRPDRTSPNQWEQEAQLLEQRNYRKLLDISVIDLNGKELMRVERQLGKRLKELRSLSDPELRQAFNGQTSFSPVSMSSEGQRSFVLTLPLRNDAGVVIGALRSEISAAPISEELIFSSTGTPNTVYMVRSSDGALLLDDSLAKFVPSPQIDLLLSSGTATSEYVGARGRSVVGAFAPLAATTLGGVTQISPVPAWSVVVEQPTAVAFSSARGSVSVLGALILLVGALALLWAFRQSQAFLKPLADLREGALALGDGHLDHRIQVSSDDELGDLARALNQTAEHLQDSLEEIERQNERLRTGLALARDIQLGLLPDRAPWSNDSIDVYARSIPAYEVGGDFYTYLALTEGRAAIAIGDISGKGVGAALLMALTSSAVESQGRQIEYPAQVLKALNQVLAPRLRANHMNAALLFAVIDPPNQTLRVANAGMIAPVLITACGSRFIDVGGLPVGSFIGATYQEEVVTLCPGDTLLLVSDGVVEAHNVQGELFGFERLEAAIAEVHPLEDVRTLVEKVLARVQAFMSNTEQHDDITLVAIRPAVSQERTAPHPQTHGEEQTTSYATV
jgi:serine phosphatase RsbU (regulator of sigma subunit)